jgi:hypothetical protein
VKKKIKMRKKVYSVRSINLPPRLGVSQVFVIEECRVVGRANNEADAQLIADALNEKERS